MPRARIAIALLMLLAGRADVEGACRALLAWLPHAREPWNVVEDLGNRYSNIGREPDAERARTTLVEVKPREAERKFW